jgi:hypothetical protein
MTQRYWRLRRRFEALVVRPVQLVGLWRCPDWRLLAASSKVFVDPLHQNDGGFVAYFLRDLVQILLIDFR